MTALSRLIDSTLEHVPSADWHVASAMASIRHRSTGDVAHLEEAACNALGVPVMALGNARSALWLALVTARLTGRVWIPAYTCVAVPNSVRAAGLEASWIDVAGGPNLDLDRVAVAAQPGDAVIAQHTYGIGPDPETLTVLRGRGVYVVEDRAHCFDARPVVGDAAVYSLEHSKLVSAGQGGLLHITEPTQRRDAQARRQELRAISNADARRIVMTSLGQLVFARQAPAVDRLGSGVRRVMLRTPATSWPSQGDNELAGLGIEPRAMHPLLAAVALPAVRAAADNLEHRTRVADVYQTELAQLVPPWVPAGAPLVRFPVLVDDAQIVHRRLRHLGADLGRRWFEAPVHPAGAASTYRPGTAPRAEELTRRVLTLPTHPRLSLRRARYLSELVRRAAGQ